MTDRYGSVRRQAEEWSERHVHVCICRGVGWLRADPRAVPLGHPLFGQPIPCVCRRDKAAADRAARLRHLSGLSDVEMAQWSLAEFDPALCRPLPGHRKRETVAAMTAIKRTCEEYATDPAGWLVLKGPTGAGKTHLAYGIVVEALRRDIPARAFNVADLLDSLRASMRQDNYDAVMADLSGVRLLVLDDLWANRSTDWSADALLQLVNHRYERRLPTVITTNADLGAENLDQRLVSRLTEGMETPGGWSRVVTLPCDDFRASRRAWQRPLGVGEGVAS